jgi:hypothetical protein
LDKYNVLGTAKTPSLDDLYDINESSESVDKTEYLSKVMSLMYLAKRTRPDILKEAGVLSTFNQSPTVCDMNKVDRVLKHIRYTRDEVLILRLHVSDLQVYVYADASYAFHTNARSHSGGIVTCGTNGGVIYAKSTKQKLVTLSSTEAEIVAVHDVLMRGIQVNNILIELGEKIKPIKLLQDNMSTICLLTKISVNSIKSKHINVIRKRHG